MIYITKLIEDNKFDLVDAITNDEVDLIFGESDELLEEIAHIRGKDNMKIIIRNFFEDTTGPHWFSMKFIPSRNIKSDSHAGKKGIPITFSKITKHRGNSIIEFPSEWKVILGSSNDTKAKKIQDELNRREKAFIDAVVKELGLLILEYWELNPNMSNEYKRLEEIRKYVESKYIK